MLIINYMYKIILFSFGAIYNFSKHRYRNPNTFKWEKK